MRIRPRQLLLEIWRSWAQVSVDSETRGWRRGGRSGSDSISDAEQLLCLFHPTTALPSFRLDQPDLTGAAMVAALSRLGDAADIQRVLVAALNDYLLTYRQADGTPRFSGAGGLVAAEGCEPTTAQRQFDLSESYAISVRLTLVALGYARQIRESSWRMGHRDDIHQLEQLASERLTAALIGLLRSFTVRVFSEVSPPGRVLLAELNRTGGALDSTREALRELLRDTAARLNDLSVGIEQSDRIDDPTHLFEFGWSWGVVRDAPRLAGDYRQWWDVAQPDGYAGIEPHLYFTVVVMNHIATLDAQFVRLLNLLNEDQLILAAALRQRRDLARAYWTTIATFGRGSWPLENLPWRTVDGAESDYFSLLVARIAVEGLARARDVDDALGRVGLVLAELASGARLTRRPSAGDPAAALHWPGVEIELPGSAEHGPALRWVCADLAPLLLSCAIQAAAATGTQRMRGQLVALAERVWDHLATRRITEGQAAGLWDQPGAAYPEISVWFEQASWAHTLRVVEALTTAASFAGGEPVPSRPLQRLGRLLVAEADHQVDSARLHGAGEDDPDVQKTLGAVRHGLDRARQISGERPGGASALLLDALVEMEALASPRAPDPPSDGEATA